MINRKHCARCGEEIPAARLKAIPDTRLCRDCSQEVGGDYITYAVAENTGKPGSLKKNYGSWTVKRKRRTITPKGA
jgi:Prokaryotic dksA/traR C4-type zinc finger